MRSTLVISGGGGQGGDGGMKARLAKMRTRMRRNLNLEDHEDIQTDAESGVCLQSFQLLDTESFPGDPVQEWGEEVEDGAVFGITLHREPVRPVSPNSSMDSLSPCESPSVFSFAQYHTVKVRRLKAATLERLISHLLDPEHQESDFTRVFLTTYQAFTTPSTLIELLFQRDDMMASLDNTTCPRSTLIPLIRLWLDEYVEDFRQPPQFTALRLLCAHLRHRLCFRRLAYAAETLLKKMKEAERVLSLSESQSASQQQEEEAEAEEKTEEEQGLKTATNEEERVDFMAFPKNEVVEELTRMDAELFVKVVPFQCLGCVWSQRDKKDKGHLSPTVRATIAQFNAVTNCVITSLLCPPNPPIPAQAPSPSLAHVNTLTPASAGTPSSSSSSPRSSSASTSPRSTSPRALHTNPARRARIIERWITIAQECRQLRNFSSLRAILSALQSNAIYRLKKTWAAVTREFMATFELLCETFPDENCMLTSREILGEDGTEEIPAPKSPRLIRKSPKLSPKPMTYSSGVIPYLGTYLTVLTMLDTALTDTVENGLINFEKRRRESEILSQIRQLQGTCSQYRLPVHPRISSWLQGQAMLTDQQSYDLSRNLEPPADSCPNSPSTWSHRLLTKKLTSLLSVHDGANRKGPHSDQISVSSSGSSGSEMEDLSTPQPLRLKLKSFSGSLQNVAEDLSHSSPTRSGSLSSTSSPSPSAKSSLRHSIAGTPPPELVSSPTPSSASSTSSSSNSPSQACLPLYNRQVCDSCIVRVSVECGNTGNVYKSILLTSQDHTPHVIQRALDKHNMEAMNHQDFQLSQILSPDKELQIPDNANVFYAMCTQANYDFVLRLRWRNHGRHHSSSSSLASSSSSSPGALAKGGHGPAK